MLVESFCPGMFSRDFAWRCNCQDRISGFPGCRQREHFAARVALAITQWHQEQATREQRVVCQSAQLVHPDAFSEARREKFEADLRKAVLLLRGAGFRL